MKYKGVLTVHCEMVCGVWPQFHDDRGVGANGQWDWDWTINFDKGTHLKNIKLTDNNGTILYDGAWTYSRYKTGTNESYFPTPLELEFEEWGNLCQKNLTCEIETDIVVKALIGDVNE